MIIEIKVPDIGIDEAEIVEILVKIGDQVVVEQSLLTIESNKALMEIPAPSSGLIRDIKVSVGDKIKTGTVIFILENNKDYFKKSNETISSLSINNKLDLYLASPQVRRLARKFEINLSRINGTGKKQRITKEDIQHYIVKAIKLIESKSFLDQKSDIDSIVDKSTTISNGYNTKKIKLNYIQKISGSNIKHSWTTIPHVTVFDQADITKLETFRKQQNLELEKNQSNIKISLLGFILKSVAYALEKMPRFKSSLSDDGKYISIKQYTNIGIAVDTVDGLIVPVLKDVDKKNIITLSKEIKVIVNKTRNNKLSVIDLRDSCFTISSIGNIGTTNFTPIINSPEVAILGVSKYQIKPIWNGNKFKARVILPLSLSFDHRVIDGADAARFISIISNLLTDICKLIVQI